ncbi:MAG: hypothetical protein WAL04_09215, partial [Acidimicrobiales bacterium]
MLAGIGGASGIRRPAHFLSRFASLVASGGRLALVVVFDIVTAVGVTVLVLVVSGRTVSHPVRRQQADTDAHEQADESFRHGADSAQTDATDVP